MMGLRATGLRKAFGDLVALDGLDLDVPRGEMVGFVGSNGAGKTTTMRIVLGVLEPDAGTVELDGRPLDAAARARIGYMPEERGLYPKMKAAEQLEHLCRLHGLDRDRARENVARWLERLGVGERRDELVGNLSLGNQQRVQLAAALAHDPDLLVLDEPFSGLDPVAVQVMSEVLRERSRAGVPVVFSSHQLDLVDELCDRVAIVSRGRIVLDGDIDELRDDGALRMVVTSRHLSRGWVDAVAGAREVERSDAGALVELARPPGVDGEVERALASVLAAAVACGPVTEFRRVRPSLSELFAEVASR
jgi:ABC-2 type transport system ATP-binding protein